MLRLVFNKISPVKFKNIFKISSLNHLIQFSTSVSTENSKEIDNSVKSLFRCSVNDPLQHGIHHLYKFYKISDTDFKRLDPLEESLHRDIYSEFKAFRENYLMIRKPAIEIINYLKNIDLSLPAYRFVMYGETNGTGKRSCLLHLMHYCLNDNWIVINLPNCSNILRIAKETTPSFYKEGRFDTPINASLFLKRFSITNMKLLKSLDLKTTKTYNWSSRDSSPAETSLLQLIEYANDRIKYASDICGVILKELKLQSSQNKFKVFVAADQINCFFGPTRLKRPDKSEILADEITIVRNFKKLFKNDWTNAVAVGTINKLGVIIPAPNRRTKYYDTSIPVHLRRRTECTLHYEGPLTPAHLLKKEGFYYLEPFVPIEIPPYTNEEISNHIEYYKDRNWIQNPDARTNEGKEEIIFLSGKNPTEFNRVCQAL